MSEAEAREKFWGPGPWQDEPDRLEWEHLGFSCLIVRQDMLGHLCGYVAVPPGHPWHGQRFDTVAASVHGGLTYSDKCSDHVCHVPREGELDDVWWLGFDAGHYWDLSPGVVASAKLMGFRSANIQQCELEYRTIEYMRRECERLAEQAAAR